MMINKTTFAGIYGNTMEWLDFLLYAYFASIFATLFFPKENPFIALLLTFGVFASGFLIRPLGGMIMGHYGDKVGRKPVLVFSLTLMTLSTIGLGLLPTYTQIGMTASILLVSLRLLQGIAVSNELNGSATFLIEHATAKNRGYAGSLAMCTAFLGILIGSALATSVSLSLSHAQLCAFGWRLPFFVAGILGFIGIFIRLHTTESAAYQRIHEKEKFPLLTILREHPLALLKVILITTVMAVGNYFILAYFTTFLKLQGVTLGHAMLFNFFAIIVIICCIPFFGKLSDKIGRKPVFLSGVIAFIVLSYPIIWMLSQKIWYFPFLAELLFALILSPVAALIPTIVAESFPTKVRNSGSSIGYNIALAIFGGTAPVVALALVKYTGNVLAPAYYLIGCAVISLLTLVSLSETHQSDL